MLIRRLLTVAALVALLAAAFVPATHADPIVYPLSEEDALARTAVREAGMRAYERDDTAAIASVVSFRAENIYRSDWMTALMRSTRGAPLRTHGPRPWIGQLLGSERPSMFPVHLRWEGRHELWWQRTRQHSSEVMRGEIEDVCELQPHDWGNEQDAVRFERRNPDALRIDCGHTCGPVDCNIFFHLPRLELRFGEG